jgi:hypothetical protein
MAASKSPDKVTTAETAGQKELGKFSFVSSTVSASTGYLPSQSGGATSQSDAPATQSLTFGFKPQVPAPSVSAAASDSQIGASSGFSFHKPVFGTPTDTKSETTAPSPFAAFTGFGSPNMPSFGGLASQTEKSTSTVCECKLINRIIKRYISTWFLDVDINYFYSSIWLNF